MTRTRSIDLAVSRQRTEQMAERIHHALIGFSEWDDPDGAEATAAALEHCGWLIVDRDKLRHAFHHSRRQTHEARARLAATQLALEGTDVSYDDLALRATDLRRGAMRCRDGWRRARAERDAARAEAEQVRGLLRELVMNLQHIVRGAGVPGQVHRRRPPRG